MEKCLAWLLIAFIAFGVSDRSAYASNDHLDRQFSKLTTHREDVPLAMVLKVKSQDRSEIQGKLVAQTEAGFILATPEPANFRLSEVKSIDTQNGQTNSGASQTSSRHHGHFLRNAVIGVAVVLVLVVVIAVAAKK